jgi:hypothetical protein
MTHSIHRVLDISQQSVPPCYFCAETSQAVNFTTYAYYDALSLSEEGEICFDLGQGEMLFFYYGRENNGDERTYCDYSPF